MSSTRSYSCAFIVLLGSLTACGSGGVNSGGPVAGIVATGASPTPSGTAIATSSSTPTAAPSATPTSMPTSTATPVVAASPTPLPSPAVYYVADGQSQAVNAYALAANGNTAPIRSITGSNTGLGYSRRVTLDPTSGTLFVANAPPTPTAHSITEYTVGSTGNIAPIRTISGSNTGLTGADGILVDKSGNLYVANCTGCFQSSGTVDSIFEFAPGATGNVAPIRTISGSNTGLAGTTEIFLDAAGDIYATSSSSTPAIYEFAPGASGNVAPIRTIQGSLTQLQGTECVVVDSAGDIFVCNSSGNEIEEFAPGASGNVAPTSVLSGSLTQLASPTQLRFDSAGNMYVANPGGPYITVYPAGATGNMVPIRTVQGNATGLQVPIGLSLSP